MISIQTAALVGQLVFGAAGFIAEEPTVDGLLWMASFWCLGVNLGANYYLKKGRKHELRIR